MFAELSNRLLTNLRLSVFVILEVYLNAAEAVSYGCQLYSFAFMVSGWCLELNILSELLPENAEKDYKKPQNSIQSIRLESRRLEAQTRPAFNNVKTKDLYFVLD